MGLRILQILGYQYFDVPAIDGWQCRFLQFIQCSCRVYKANQAQNKHNETINMSFADHIKKIGTSSLCAL